MRALSPSMILRTAHQHVFLLLNHSLGQTHHADSVAFRPVSGVGRAHRAFREVFWYVELEQGGIAHWITPDSFLGQIPPFAMRLDLQRPVLAYLVCQRSAPVRGAPGARILLTRCRHVEEKTSRFPISGLLLQWWRMDPGGLL
jgi:hypothetical protein